MSEHDKTNPPQAAISRKQMARSLFQNGELKQAESLYEELCRENNMDAESYYMLGSINGQLGNTTIRPVTSGCPSTCNQMQL